MPPRLIPGTVLDQKLQGYSQFCLKGREVIGLLELQQEHDGDGVGGVQILEKGDAGTEEAPGDGGGGAMRETT